MEHRIIVSLVTWNSAHYLPELFASLTAQTEQSLEVLVTDNASADESVLLLSELLPTLPFPTTLFREKENTGFAAAHNHHIREALRRKARAILILNPDCFLEEHAIATLVSIMEQNERLGSVGGKILRAHFATEHGLTKLVKLSTIDSTGLVMTRARAWRERGYGEEDRGQYAEGFVFGLSGAFVLYRLRALVDTALRREGKREFFDEDFFSYKEDVDLAWRLQLFGWSAWYTPHAIAWHHRTFGRERRAHVPARLRALSWRNNYFVLLKNDTWRFGVDVFLTIGRECVKFLWILFREPRTLQLLPSLFRLWPRMREKRQWIMTHRRQSFPLSSSTTKPKDS